MQQLLCVHYDNVLIATEKKQIAIELEKMQEI